MYNFPISFQIEILAAMITDEKFLSHNRDVLNPSYFETKELEDCAKYVLLYFDRYKHNPTIAELRVMFNEMTRKNLISNSRLELLQALLDNVSGIIESGTDLTFAKEKAIAFAKGQALYLAAQQIVEMSKTAEFVDYSKARSILDKALSVGEESGGVDYFGSIIPRLKHNLLGSQSEPIPTMISEIDNAINGGLRAGEVGMILAPTGRGKSIVLSNFAFGGAWNAKNVLIVSTELSEDAIGTRLDMMFSGFSRDMIANYPKEFVAKMSEIRKKVRGKIWIKTYKPRKATVDTIRIYIDKLYSLHNFKVDLLVVDYIDKIKSPIHYSDKRWEFATVSESLVGLSKDLEIPIWTASQTNRSGYRATIVQMDTVSEAINKIQDADVVISLSQTQEERESGIMRFYFAKVRNARSGFAKKVMINYDTLRIKSLPINRGFDDDESDE